MQISSDNNWLGSRKNLYNLGNFLHTNFRKPCLLCTFSFNQNIHFILSAKVRYTLNIYEVVFCYLYVMSNVPIYVYIIFCNPFGFFSIINMIASIFIVHIIFYRLTWLWIILHLFWYSSNQYDVFWESLLTLQYLIFYYYLKRNFSKQYCDYVVAIGNIFTITIKTLILFITKFNWSLILFPIFFYFIINL